MKRLWGLAVVGCLAGACATGADSPDDGTTNGSSSDGGATTSQGGGGATVGAGATGGTTMSAGGSTSASGGGMTTDDADGDGVPDVDDLCPNDLCGGIRHQPHESGSDLPGATGSARSFDFDFDGNVDVMVGFRHATVSAPPTQARIYLGNGDGSFQPHTVVRDYPSADFGSQFAIPQRLCTWFPITQ